MSRGWRREGKVSIIVQNKKSHWYAKNWDNYNELFGIFEIFWVSWKMRKSPVGWLEFTLNYFFGGMEFEKDCFIIILAFFFHFLVPLIICLQNFLQNFTLTNNSISNFTPNFFLLWYSYQYFSSQKNLRWYLIRNLISNFSSNFSLY